MLLGKRKPPNAKLPNVRHVAPADYKALFHEALSGLSWAVGHIEGRGSPKDNYAARVLERLTTPRLVIDIPQLDAEEARRMFEEYHR